MIELEVKAVVPDPEALRRTLRQAVGDPAFEGRLLDSRYDDGRLAPLEQVLRVRRYAGRDGSIREELGWKGPTTRSSEGYKQRSELEAGLSGGAPVAQILEALGYRVVHRVDRYIESYAVAGATVRIEWYPDSETLVEVEGDPEAIEAAILVTGLTRASFTADALVTFAAAWSARTGSPARLALNSPDEQPAHWPR